MLLLSLCGRSFLSELIGYGLDDQDEFCSSDRNFFVCDLVLKSDSFAVGA